MLILVNYCHHVTSTVWPGDLLSPNLGHIYDVCQRVPVLQQRRTDLYTLRQCLKWVVCTAGIMFCDLLFVYHLKIYNVTYTETMHVTHLYKHTPHIGDKIVGQRLAIVVLVLGNCIIFKTIIMYSTADQYNNYGKESKWLMLRR